MESWLLAYFHMTFFTAVFVWVWSNTPEKLSSFRHAGRWIIRNHTGFNPTDVLGFVSGDFFTFCHSKSPSNHHLGDPFFFYFFQASYANKSKCLEVFHSQNLEGEEGKKSKCPSIQISMSYVVKVHGLGLAWSCSQRNYWNGLKSPPNIS